MTLKLLFPWAQYRRESFQKRKCLISHFSIMCVLFFNPVTFFWKKVGKKIIKIKYAVQNNLWQVVYRRLWLYSLTWSYTETTHVWPPFSRFIFPPSFKALSILPSCHTEPEHLFKSVLSSSLYSDSPPIRHPSICSSEVSQCSGDHWMAWTYNQISHPVCFSVSFCARALIL